LPKTKRHESEPDLQAMMRVLGSAADGAPELLVRAEMHSWKIDLEPWQKHFCILSHVFRDLTRQEASPEKVFFARPKREGFLPPSPLWGETEPRPHPKPTPEQLYNLTRLWQIAGEPADKLPSEWKLGAEDEIVQDRGEAGVWANWESACWFCCHLDERLDHADMASVLY
jgi:hypothetical protein